MILNKIFKTFGIRSTSWSFLQVELNIKMELSNMPWERRSMRDSGSIEDSDVVSNFSYQKDRSLYLIQWPCTPKAIRHSPWLIEVNIVEDWQTQRISREENKWVGSKTKVAFFSCPRTFVSTLRFPDVESARSLLTASLSVYHSYLSLRTIYHSFIW